MINKSWIHRKYFCIFGIEILKSFALSICVLFILLMRKLYGARFLKANFLSLLFKPTAVFAFGTVAVP